MIDKPRELSRSPKPKCETVSVYMHTEQELHHVLRSTFGFSSFREGQLEAISTLLNDRHLLCIHPTGFGKSLLYQLPAVILSGMTLVISPLLALMRDQEEHLRQRFNIKAASINSDQTLEENQMARFQASQGALRILFVSPEQLDNLDSFQFLLKLPISLIVVDEAHCISTWGHDFRPSYRQILTFVETVKKTSPEVRVLGLTATANRKTEEDIHRQLSVFGSNLKVMRKSMDRPNISLSVLRVSSTAAKLDACLQLLQQLEGCGLIYCATRENTELVAAFLKSKKIDAIAYHAGMEASLKCELQRNFIQDKYKVIAATNALGMGIDKSNLRYIIHFDIPGSVTAYYQEVGRCGRDGQPANGIILYDYADTKIQEYFIESAQPTEKDFSKVLETVKQAPLPIGLTGIKSLTGLHPTRVIIILAELIEQGFVQKTKEKKLQVYVPMDKIGQPSLERYTRQFDVKMRELRQMIKYAHLREACLMGFLRKSLGDLNPSACGHCDGCAGLLLKYKADQAETEKIQTWMDAQTMEIAGNRTYKLSNGIALLDGKQKSAMFSQFMRGRAEKTSFQDLPDELLSLLKLQLNKIVRDHQITALIPLPSRTWLARNDISTMLGRYLNLPVLHDLLVWQEEPVSRQGFLFNNDQRTQNVHEKMGISSTINLPKGNILLFDDYTGSGATLKEAARVFRKTAKFDKDIVPFTIAVVKWKLGAPGMI